MQLSTTDQLRLEILNNSLDFEFIISHALCDLLNIDYETSKSLGNTSNGLSLSAKVGILLDMKAIDKDNSTILTTYMEIRNKFMHDLKCTSFEKCFAILDKGKYLIKRYKPDEKLDLEERYEYCVDKLGVEAANVIVQKILDMTIKEKIEIENKGKDKLKLKGLEGRISKEIIQLSQNTILQQKGFTDTEIFEIQKELIIKILDI